MFRTITERGRVSLVRERGVGVSVPSSATRLESAALLFCRQRQAREAFVARSNQQSVSVCRKRETEQHNRRATFTGGPSAMRQSYFSHASAGDSSPPAWKNNAIIIFFPSSSFFLVIYKSGKAAAAVSQRWIMDGRSDYAETPAATRLAMHIGSGRRWKADQKPVRARLSRFCGATWFWFWWCPKNNSEPSFLSPRAGGRTCLYEPRPGPKNKENQLQSAE